MAKQMDEARAINSLRHKIRPKFKLLERDLPPYEKKLRELCKQATFDKANDLGRESEENREAMSEEEKQEALTLLRDPNIDQTIINDIDEIGFVGEDANKLFQYCAATSRKLDSPINTAVKGQTSIGKSDFLKAIKKLMPAEDVVYYTRITPQALGYMENGKLEHKWLIVAERKGSEDGDYNIRIIQSEKEIIVALPVRNPTSGETVTKEIKVKGPIAYSESTTKNVLNAENESRVFDIFLDDSEEQTKAINKRQAEDATLDGIIRQNSISKITRKHQNAQRLLQTLTVVVPYAPLIRFPSGDPTDRRHFPKFLEVIKVIAFLRQHQKEAIVNGGNMKYIEADLKDYELAWKYGRQILGNTLDPLPKLSREMLKRIRDYVKEKANSSSMSDIVFSRKDIVYWVGRDETYVRTHVAPLESNEYVQIVEGGQGKAYKYRLAVSDEQIDKEYAKGITTPEELAQLLHKTNKSD